MCSLFFFSSRERRRFFKWTVLLFSLASWHSCFLFSCNIESAYTAAAAAVWDHFVDSEMRTAEKVKTLCAHFSFNLHLVGTGEAYDKQQKINVLFRFFFSLDVVHLNVQIAPFVNRFFFPVFSIKFMRIRKKSQVSKFHFYLPLSNRWDAILVEHFFPVLDRIFIYILRFSFALQKPNCICVKMLNWFQVTLWYSNHIIEMYHFDRLYTVSILLSKKNRLWPDGF